MNTIQIRGGSVVDLQKHQPVVHPEYTEILAASLIAYAARDKTFAGILLESLREFVSAEEGGAQRVPREIFMSVGLFMPDNTRQAKRRLEWLSLRIAEDALPGSERAKAYLADWVEEHTRAEPKALIIGEIVGIIPTIGIGQPKRHKKKLSVIIRRESLAGPKLSLMENVTQANIELLMRALALAKGNIRKLEPEFADWLFGERRLRFYTASENTLRAIEEDLSLKGVRSAYAAMMHEERIVLLALSPTVNTGYQEGWDIEPIDTLI